MRRTERRDEARWPARPVLSFALRLVSVLIPTVVGIGGALAFVGAIPMPGGVAAVPWFLALAVVSTLATATAERLGKRFLPLATLLRLSLVFPDRAPSRFAMARGAGNVRVLERRIRDAREHGLDPEPARAAEQILTLVAALSAHDRKTRGHSERVRAFTDMVAGQLHVPETDRDRLRWAALLHDVGKLKVPAKILTKPGRPDPHEWELLKGHPAEGARIAAPLLTWLGSWSDAIEQHHERFDGDGYPAGLAGDEISLAARIVSVADSFEVMTASRSYKKPMSVPAARRELAACAGGQFDPAIVRAFLNVSLGRLWWAIGPASWTALLPLLGPAQRAGGQLVAAAKGATAAVAVGAAGFLPIVGSTAAASAPRGPAVSERVAQGSGQANDAPASDAPASGVGRRGGDEPAEDDPVEPPRDRPGDDASGGGSGEDSPDDVVPVDPADPDDPTRGPLDGAVDAVDETVDGAVGAVDDVVDGVGDTVDDVVDGTTDVVDELVGGLPLEGVLDEPVDDVTDLLGDLLGS